MGVAQNTLNENHFNFQMKYSQEHFKEALMARAKRGNPVGKLLHHKHANLLPAQGFSSSNASKYLFVILSKITHFNIPVLKEECLKIKTDDLDRREFYYHGITKQVLLILRWGQWVLSTLLGEW